jgi:nicotinamide-nucleotide amidase
MRIGLLNIGDELLLGKTLNTNAFDLARWLGELGHELVFTLAIEDRPDDISDILRDVSMKVGTLPRCEKVLLTGGLGPTRDDLTREAVAGFLGVSLEYSSEAEGWLAERLGVKADVISEGQRQQLYVPQGTTPLRNPAGTACGFRVEISGVQIFAFPGVPSEFRAMFDLHCRPLLLRGDAVLLRKRIFTFGLPEGRQRELLRGFATPEPFRFSSLPSESGVAIALEAFVDNAEVTDRKIILESEWKELLSRLPSESIVDEEGATLSEAVFHLLRRRGSKVAVAESCTAGAVGYLFTEMPGSSEVFSLGYITYANEAKTTLLGVSPNLLAAEGAVSEAVALAMAKGCLNRAGTDYAVAITGIAGPGGGTSEKPVGLVYIAVSSIKRADVRRFQLRGDRKSVRWLSAYSALNQLRLFIINDL